MVTITIPQELERPLNERAQERGLTPVDAAVELLRQGLQPPSLSFGIATNRDARQDALKAIRDGKYVRSQSPDEPLASDRFANDKAEERAREERRWTA
jgi:hypothetical protein